MRAAWTRLEQLGEEVVQEAETVIHTAAAAAEARLETAVARVSQQTAGVQQRVEAVVAGAGQTASAVLGAQLSQVNDRLEQALARRRAARPAGTDAPAPSGRRPAP